MNWWSTENTKWLMGLVGSLLVSAVVGWASAQFAIRSEIEEGRAVFNNIGIRYFDALLRAHLGQVSDGTGMPTGGAKASRQNNLIIMLSLGA